MKGFSGVTITISGPRNSKKKKAEGLEGEKEKKPSDCGGQRKGKKKVTAYLQGTAGTRKGKKPSRWATTLRRSDAEEKKKRRGGDNCSQKKSANLA